MVTHTHIPKQNNSWIRNSDQDHHEPQIWTITALGVMIVNRET